MPAEEWPVRRCHRAFDLATSEIARVVGGGLQSKSRSRSIEMGTGRALLGKNHIHSMNYFRRAENISRESHPRRAGGNGSRPSPKRRSAAAM